ncbi:unnamed protein product [Phytomonas sp. Hart1]|nr:unnamed protein product [Phytomonas sp. Hart1]|eukprot:CCW70886.1 unnamed protein product [Phytomonas sp. isolate Hart1]
MYRASLQIQRLIECYLSYSYDFGVCKLLPASYNEKECGGDNSSVAIYTAQEYLEHLPYLLQGSSATCYSEFSEDEKQLIHFLSSVLLRALNHHSSRCCGETTSGSDAMGKRSTFIIWMVLAIYSHFAQEAEKRSPNWYRVDNLKEAVLTSSLKARYRVLSEWVEKRYLQGRHDPAFSEFSTPPKQTFQQPDVDPVVFGSFFSQIQDVDTNEEEVLWSEVENLFHGEKGKLTDPLAADKNLFFNFFLEYVDPILQRYPRWKPSAYISPFASLQSKDSDAWCRDCLVYARCQFKVHPFSPEASIIEAVVAATEYTLPCLKKVRVFTEYWEERYVDWVRRQSNRRAAAGNTQPSAKKMAMPAESLSDQRSGDGFVMDYTSSLYQALSVAHGAVQLIPSSLHAEEVEGGGALSEASPASSHLCGSWLSAAAATLPSHSVRRYHLLQPSRACVVFPGLAISAVEIVSAFLSSTGPSGIAPGSFPDSIVGAGTMLVSPSSARYALSTLKRPFLAEGPSLEMDDAHTDCSKVRILSSAELHPSVCVILMSRLPECALPNAEDMLGEAQTAGKPVAQSFRDNGAIPFFKLTDLVDVVGGVREGIVLILVEAHIGKRELRLMEGWGTGARTVVVVGSIGKWGMSQLSLRWGTVPNTPFTEPSKLRCIRDSKAGVLLYPLDEMDLTMPCVENRKGFIKRATLDVVERRTRWLVVIGECECADQKRSLKDAQVDRTFSMSMPMDDDRSDVSCSTSSDSNATNSWGSNAQDTDDAMCTDLPHLSFFGHVICSILVGGATDALQRKGLLMARVVWQHIVHRAVLPERLSSLLPTADGRVERSVLDRVRQLRTTMSPFTCKPVEGSSGSMKPEALVLFHTGILEGMERGLQSYLLSCAQNDLGFQAEEAWKWLNQTGMSDSANLMSDTNGSPGGARVFISTDTVNTSNETDVAGEVYFTVRSAYLAIASCLDELCHTALIGSHTSMKSVHQGLASEDLYFLPLIE